MVFLDSWMSFFEVSEAGSYFRGQVAGQEDALIFKLKGLSQQLGLRQRFQAPGRALVGPLAGRG